MAAASVISRSLPSFRVGRRPHLFLVLVLLNVLDVVLTQIGLDRGAIEQNGLMAGPVAAGYLTATLAKAACLAVGFVAVSLSPPRSRLIDAGLVFCVCWYVGVVCWNLTVIADLS